MANTFEAIASPSILPKLVRQVPTRQHRRVMARQASPASAKKATEAARSFNKTLAGTYVVTANVGLHIRNGAGTGKASLAVLPKGTKVANYGYYTLVGNVKWLYVQVTYKGCHGIHRILQFSVFEEVNKCNLEENMITFRQKGDFSKRRGF